MNDHILRYVTRKLFDAAGLRSAAGEIRNRVVSFSPGETMVARSQMTAFMHYCEIEAGRLFPDWTSFQRFSVDEFRTFWRLFFAWSGLLHEGSPDPACTDDLCERAVFFPEVRLNYAENVLAAAGEEQLDLPAITSVHEGGGREQLTRRELRGRVIRLMAALDRLGLRSGDRVANIAHNSAETVIAALAVTGLGAVFSSSSPDMGAFAILNRFQQLDPTILMCHLRDAYEGARGQLEQRVAEVVQSLPSLKAVVQLDGEQAPRSISVPWFSLAELLSKEASECDRWERFPFNQPLFILFSSGTTGAPKCIVHGAGGTLLEHCKEHRLHCDLSSRDKLFFQTSCGWMMWNWQLSALASGTEIVLYDGPIGGPETLWNLVAREGVTVFGTNPGYLHYCADAGFSPSEEVALPNLRAILSTGSILFDRQYDWVDRHVKSLPLHSISGGTDIIGCFVLGNPNLPVYRGESQCRSLGLDVQALVRHGDGPKNGIGELVCANPFPSRPLGFHGDRDGERFHRAYFSQNEGVWTHGDFIEFTPQGTARLHGRSDGVLNVRGVRVGPAEIYRILQDIPEITEAMAVEQRVRSGAGGSRVVLLVVLRGGATLDRALASRIKRELSRRGSQAHVPAVIAQVDQLPMTHSGKRSEQAARNAIEGRRVANFEALRNPECLDMLANHPALKVETGLG